MRIHFEKAAPHHQLTLLQWLSEPHVMEFWDNSQEHKEDILNFIYGRKQTYIAGTTKYWVGYIDHDPYSLVLSDILEKNQQDVTELHRQHIPLSGSAVGLDFAIGNTKYLGKGLAAATLEAFVHFYNRKVDPSAHVFFIDPDEKNIRAKHVYSKAGFEEIGSFDMPSGTFQGAQTILMVKRV